MVVRPEERSLPQTLLTYFLQVLGAVTAIFFGVFGVLSWSDGNLAKRQAETALQQADTANFLALVALCVQGSQGGSSSFSEFCDGVQAAAEASVTSLASSLLGPITPTSTFTSSASSASNPRSSATETSTTTAVAVPPAPGVNVAGFASGGPGPVSLGSGAKLGLGLGIGLTAIVVFITAMTVWTVRSKRRPLLPFKFQ